MVRTPAASSPEAGERMARTRRRDTSCELAVRRAVHARGLRYRVDQPLPMNRRRRADLWFPRARVAVFIDGCFWHACPIHGTAPAANASWWSEKLAANVVRDRDTDRILARAGWRVVRVWEHEHPDEAADRVEQAVRRLEPLVTPTLTPGVRPGGSTELSLQTAEHEATVQHHDVAHLAGHECGAVGSQHREALG